MKGIGKGYSLKIISIAVVVTFSITTALYGLDISSEHGLRSYLMYSNDNNKGGRRVQTAFKSVYNKLKQLKHKDDEGLKGRNKHRFSISYFWRRSLGSKQEETVGNIIDLYNETYGLNIREVAKKDIIAKKILLVNRSRTPFVFLLYASLFYDLFGVIYNTVHLETSFSVSGLMLLMLMVLYAYLSHDTVWNPIQNKIILPLKIYKDDRCNFEFLWDISHELAHFLKLPNNSLLANAYTGLAIYAITPNEWNNFIKKETKGVRSFMLADEALKDGSDLATKETTIRKILSNKKLKQKLEDCHNEQEVRYLFRETAKNLVEKDYKIPRIKFDAFTEWVYIYGITMAYFAIQNFTDTTLAMQFIYRLGQIRDSKKLEDFRSNLADDPQSPLISIRTAKKSGLLKKFDEVKIFLTHLKTGL